MTTQEATGKVGEDLAYVRAVVERQRKLLCEHVPIWFAGLIGLWFAGQTVLRDLVNQGAVTADAREWFGNIGLVLLLAILLGRAAIQRRRGDAGHRPKFAAREVWRLLLPWIVFIGGVILFKQLGTAAGLEKDVLRPFLLTFGAVVFTVIGLSTIHIILGFGLGLGVGAIAFAFFDLAYPHSVLGVATAIGLVLGAYADQLRVRGA